MRPAELEDVGKLLLRVVVAGLMLFHGFDKIAHGPGHVMQDLAEHGMPVVLGYGVYIGEVLAPILILVGAWTRLAALVYAVEHPPEATRVVEVPDIRRGAW